MITALKVLVENIYEFIAWGIMTIIFAAVSLFTSFGAYEKDPHFDIAEELVLAGIFIIVVFNLAFFFLIFPSLGKNSQLLFYAAGTNQMHRSRLSNFFWKTYPSLISGQNYTTTI